MCSYSQIPHALYAIDMEKRWTTARESLAEKVESLRQSGCRVSHYRGSIVITMPRYLGNTICLVDAIRSSCSTFLVGRTVPSLKAAIGAAYGSRFGRGIDYRMLSNGVKLNKKISSIAVPE